jgi:hypothetical protein
MNTTTKLVGAPISVDYLPIKGKTAIKRHPIQVTICCGSYNDVIVIEYLSEADAAHGFMMWQELIVAAENYEAE